MTWWEMVAAGAGAWVFAAFMLGPVIGRWLRRSRQQSLPQRVPLGDYVPGECVAEHEKKNRGRP